MKKIAMVIVVCLLVSILAGCESSYEKKMNDLNKEIKGYQDDINDLERELAGVRGKIRAYGN